MGGDAGVVALAVGEVVGFGAVALGAFGDALVCGFDLEGTQVLVIKVWLVVAWDNKVCGYICGTTTKGGSLRREI